AARLGCSVGDIERLVEAGELDCDRDFGVNRLDVESLREVLGAEGRLKSKFKIQNSKFRFEGGETRRTASDQLSVLRVQKAGALPGVEAFAGCPKSLSGMPLLSTRQAAAAIGVSVDEVSRALRRGDLDGWR